MSLECGRNPGHPEKSHVITMRTYKLYTDSTRSQNLVGRCPDVVSLLPFPVNSLLFYRQQEFSLGFHIPHHSTHSLCIVHSTFTYQFDFNLLIFLFYYSDLITDDDSGSGLHRGWAPCSATFPCLLDHSVPLCLLSQLPSLG